jgi:hypothetical protein
MPIDITLLFWILFFFGIGYYGLKRYRDKKNEQFEDRDN